MNTKTVEKADWEAYFNRFSKESGAAITEIEVAGLDIGDQIEAEWLSLNGISYDARNDVIAIDLESKDGESLEHMIHQPVELVVQEDVEGIASLTIVDAAGHKQILHLKKALSLPAA